MADGTATPELTRRKRLREGMVDEIKTRAQQQLVEGGPGAVSLRAIARDMGTASSALFRYFPTYNDLITALVVDALDSLGDALTAARDSQPDSDHAARMFAIGLGYRSWAIAHPSEFALTHGTPIPGYEAPPEITGPPAARALWVPTDAYLRAVTDGAADPARTPVPANLTASPALTGLLGESMATVDPQVLGVVLNARASMMGYLIAEIFGRLSDLIAGPDDLYRAHLRTIMLGMGFAPESIPTLTPRSPQHHEKARRRRVQPDL